MLLTNSDWISLPDLLQEKGLKEMMHERLFAVLIFCLLFACDSRTEPSLKEDQSSKEDPTLKEAQEQLIGRWKLVRGLPKKQGMEVEFTPEREVRNFNSDGKRLEPESLRLYWHLAKHQSGGLLLFTERSYITDELFTEVWESDGVPMGIFVDDKTLKWRVFTRGRTGPATPSNTLTVEFERLAR